VTAPENADFLNPQLYFNRWVAVVRGQVIGVGVTRAQAERAARQNRPKDTPQLYFVAADGHITQPEIPMINPNPAAWLRRHALLGRVAQILRAQQLEAYLVGGAVRDFLLGRPHIVDLDFALPGDGLAAARRVADALGGGFYPLDVERATGRVVCDQPDSTEKVYLDFASFRGRDLTADLLDRDFSLNAIALSLAEPLQLIDPAQGRRDLAAGQIRMVDATAFQRDPVRLIRAVRQAVAFGFTIEAGTAAAMPLAAPLLPRISAERQRDELLKLLNTPAPGQALQMLHQLKVLGHLLPEVEATVGVTQSPPHRFDVFAHTAAALDNWANMDCAGWPDLPAELRAGVADYLNTGLAGAVSARKLMPLAILLHDTGKPATRAEEAAGPVRFVGHEKLSAEAALAVGQRLRLSSQAVNFVELVVRHHMRPGWLATEPALTRRAIFRFFNDAAGKGLNAGPAVALHALADAAATGHEVLPQFKATVIRLLENFFTQHAQVVDPPLLLSGRDLIETLGLRQGKPVGYFLRRLKEAQAVGEVSTVAEALAFIKSDPDFARYQAGEL